MTLIIIDDRISPEAKNKLFAYGELMELKTDGITYPAISGHPDIFFCQGPGYLIVAPNLPEQYLASLWSHGIEFISGELPVGREYPASAHYNAVATDSFLIHNFRTTDFMITRTHEDLHLIHVDQGYTRCNLLPLKDNCFITSDEGIFKVLQGCHLPDISASVKSQSSNNQTSYKAAKGCHLCYVSPLGILLPSFPHGFFGGCCGVWNDIVFINGSLKHLPDGEKVRDFLSNLDYQIIELYDGPLVDIGSILFVDFK
jgi:hypothetical protein